MLIFNTYLVKSEQAFYAVSAIFLYVILQIKIEEKI